MALVVVILVSVFVTIQTFTPKSETATSPFYVGIEFGYGNASDCKLLIDKVKNYTNLIVISSTIITQNEFILNDTCDYAYKAGLHIIVYFPSIDPIFSTTGESGSYHAYLWAMKAKDKYGPNFLGSYIYDEAGGEVLDRASGAVNINYVSYSGVPYSVTTDYKSAAINFEINAHNQMDAYLYCAKKAGTSVMTADYGLYWFDYKAGYDTVFAEFGWGNNRQMAIALCRGAATAQNKDWGAIICWDTYTNNTGTMENGAALYKDLTLAYDNGAKYAVIFDYAGKDSATNRDLPNPYEFGILNDEHFAALENFWNYVQQNPAKHNSVKATAALVLPQYYGFGFRSADDKIWGMDQADNWTTKMWNDANSLLGEYGGGLDIVYSDAEFQAVISNSYERVIPWASRATSQDYPVVNLNSTLGYPTIQKAISSGATVSGDTLFVKAGTYKENVEVNKPVTLVGINKETTIIDGDNKGSALRVMSPNVTIRGFTIENGNNPLITDLTSQLASINSGTALLQVLQQYGFDPTQISTLDPSSLQTLMIQLTQPIGNTLTPSTNSGIYLSNADNCTLMDNVVTNNTYGIVLASSANSTLKSNTLTDNKYGFGISATTDTTAPIAAPAQYAQKIDSSNTINGKPIYYWTNENSLTVPSDAGYVGLVNCTNITVQNLELTNNINGLLIVNTESSTIRNNTLVDNYEGLRLADSVNNSVQNNNINNNIYNLADSIVSTDIDPSNRVNGKTVYIWIDQHDKVVPTDAGYAALVNCSGITVQNLNLTNNAVGIFMQNTSNSTITHNTLANMNCGIKLSAASSTIVTENTITASQDGIIMENASSNNYVAGNVINQNQNSGITLQSSTNNYIQNNKVTSNNEGIVVADSSSNTLNGNVLASNYYGITFSVNAQSYSYPQESTCAQNVVIENNLTQNICGIQIAYNVINNTFYHNNFVNNTQQASTSSSSSTPVNIWDNGDQGNYWSNYNGTDINLDGLGDQAMNIYEQYQQYTMNGVPQHMLITPDQDHFPLIHPSTASIVEP